jgi:hypothetical protein
MYLSDVQQIFKFTGIFMIFLGALREVGSLSYIPNLGWAFLRRLANTN